MCCLGCCEQSVRLVDLVPYVNSLFKEICVECMVFLIGINNFQDPLVNWRQVHVGFVYMYRHIIFFICTERIILTITPVYKYKKKNFQEVPKIFYSWNGQYILYIFWSVNKYLVASVLHMIQKWMKFILFNSKTNELFCGLLQFFL